MTERPRYANIFEYLEEHHTMNSPDTPLTRFYKYDMYERQFPELDGPVNEDRFEFSDPEAAGDMIREFALAAGADMVGFTTVQEHFVFEGVEEKNRFCVVLAMEMDHTSIAMSPEQPSGVEVLRVYWRIGDIACKVGAFIRSLGYPARVHHPRSFTGFPPTMLHTVAAIEAGLGELGRLGVLITEEFGPRVRLVTIATDLELPAGKRKRFGVEEYCSKCHICREACEGDAIPDEKTVVRGFEKYTIDPYKCLPYFAKYDGCNICVARCPFNKPPRELARFNQDHVKK